MRNMHLPDKMANLRVPIIVLGAAVVLSISYLLFLHSHSQGIPVHAPVSVTTAAVSKIDKAIEIPAAGSVESRKAAVVGAQIAGRIINVSVTNGQMVTAGQELVTIQGTAPVVRSNTTAPANTPSMQNGEANPEAQANYESIQKKYEQYQKLYQLGAVPRRQVEDLEAQLAAAREALSSPSESTVSSPSPVPSGTTAGSQEVVATITAPVAGKIMEITAANEATVQTGQQLMVVDSGGDVRVVVQLSQEDLYLIHTGTQTKIVLPDAPDQIFTGQVEGIFPEIGAQSQSFRTHIRVDNTNGVLKPGQTVNAAFCMDQTVPVNAVPALSVIKEKETNYIFLAVNGKAVRQEVTTGSHLGDFIEITSDLPDSARVITSHVTDIKDGDSLNTQESA